MVKTVHVRYVSSVAIKHSPLLPPHNKTWGGGKEVCFTSSGLTCHIPGVFQARRCSDHAGVLRRGTEAVVGSSGWKRSCKNPHWQNCSPLPSTLTCIPFYGIFALWYWEKKFPPDAGVLSPLESVLRSSCLPGGRSRPRRTCVSLDFTFDFSWLCHSDLLCLRESWKCSFFFFSFLTWQFFGWWIQ